jgi:hypothetical protein
MSSVYVLFKLESIVLGEGYRKYALTRGLLRAERKSWVFVVISQMPRQNFLEMLRNAHAFFRPTRGSEGGLLLYDLQ